MVQLPVDHSVATLAMVCKKPYLRCKGGDKRQSSDRVYSDLSATVGRCVKRRNKMTLKKCSLKLLLITIFAAAPFYCVSVSGSPSNSGEPGSSRQPADVKGTWSGTFYSRHPGEGSFTMTVKIDADARARLVGKSSLSSGCLRDIDLSVTVSGSKVSLAGSDRDGASITFQGTLDETGSVLKLHYIVNGSASGKCESDDGEGNLLRR